MAHCQLRSRNMLYTVPVDARLLMSSTQTDNLHTLVITVMNIYLTNHADVRHTKFCTADGQTLYKSETPGWFHAGKKTTIYKVIPNDDPEDMSTLSQFCIYCRLIKSTHSILS